MRRARLIVLSTLVALVTAVGGSFVAGGSPAAAATPPPAPTNVQQYGDVGVVYLAWYSGGGNTAGFNVYRSTSQPVPLTSPLNGSSLVGRWNYTDTNVVGNTTYWYVVQAVNAEGDKTEAAAISSRPKPGATPTPTATATSSPSATATPTATPTVTATSSPTPTATAGGSLVISNPEVAISPNRFVMSRMSYDPTPTSMVRMQDPDNNNVLTWFKFNDVAQVRLTNSGSTALTVTSLSIANPSFFTTTQTVPFTIAARTSRDVPVRFVFGGGSIFGADLRESTLTVTATGQPAKTVQLAGIWQPGPNRYPGTTWDFEPSLAKLVQAFGWGTNIGGSGYLNSNGGFPYGDEKVSKFWKAADPTKPVELQLIAGYNSGGFGQVNWYRSNDAQGCAWQTQASCRSILYMADGNGATTGFPRLTQGVVPRPSYDYTIHPFSPGTQSFGLQAAGEFSDDSRNSTQYDVEYHSCAPVAQCGHHLRFFPLKTAAGAVVPNAWIVAVDQLGINVDFNDNVYVVTNMAPVS